MRPPVANAGLETRIVAGVVTVAGPVAVAGVVAVGADVPHPATAREPAPSTSAPKTAMRGLPTRRPSPLAGRLKLAPVAGVGDLS